MHDVPRADAPIAQIDEQLEAAFAAIDAQQFDAAEALCRQILARDARHFEAMVTLGVLAGQTGRASLGIQLLQGAVAIEPQSAATHLQLGALLAGDRRLTEAIASLEKAVRLEPDNAAAHCNLAMIYLANGQMAEAMVCFERAIGLDPDLASAHYHLGVVLELQGRESDAGASYRRAIRADADLADAHARLGCLLLSQGATTEALDCFQRAVAKDPDSELGRLSEARILLESDNTAEAEKCLQQALARFPGSSDLHYLLGGVMRQQGRFDEAIACFERAISLNPRHGAAYFDLVGVKRLTEAARPLIARMETTLRNAAIDDAKRIGFHFALGKAYDDLAEYEAAIRHYDEANRLKNRSFHFDPDRLERSFGRLIAAFPSDFFERVKSAGSDSELPVLIVGMPRSGTTLVEQILSNHPEVGGAGELAFWHEGMWTLSRSGKKGLDISFMHKLAGDYLELLRGVAPGARRVTDKMPDNFIRIGLIHAVFPRAHIIHCRRHPVDTALSIYFNNFNQGNDYTYARDNIVFYYEHYLRLMAHWRSVLPPERFIEIDYEELIADRENVTRRLIAFCGLDWNEACLQHEKNTRVVKTASMWQARQPIYGSSVARWRCYEPWLGEFSRLLPAERS